MPDLPKVGVEAIIEGMAKFKDDATTFSSTISGPMTSAAQGGASAISSLGDMAGSVLTVGFAAATAAAAALSAAFVFSVGQAMDNEKQIASLNQVIKSTGGSAGLTAEKAQELATQFSGLSGGSDDAILSIETMALKMGNITADQMPAFIQTTLDLAAATGQDATSAARLLAQAQEDPISSLSRFRKMGIQFTDDQKKQIKALQDSGDTAGAFAIVMDRVGLATAGAASGQAETLAGQIEIFKGTIGEAAEAIGTAFLPMLHELFDSVIAPAIPLITAAADVIAKFFAAFVTGEDPIGAIANLFFNLATTFGATKEQATALFFAVQAGSDQAQAGLNAFLVACQPVIAAAQNLAAVFIASLPMIQATVANMVAFVQAQFATFMPVILANVTTILNEMAAFWTAHGAQIMAVVQLAFEFITVTIGGTMTLISGLIAAAWALINGDTTTAGETMKTTTTAFMNAVLSIVGTDMTTFTATWQADWNMLVTIMQAVWRIIVTSVSQGIINVLAAAQALVSGFVGLGTAIINGIIAGVQAAASNLAQAAIDAVNSALAAAKAAVGIHSPSETAANEIGLPLGQGIAQGLLAALSGVQAAASVVTLGAVSAGAVSAGAVMNSSQSVSNTTQYNYSPTYGGNAPNPSYDFSVMRAAAL